MKCAICRQGDTNPGHATATLVRGASTIVVKGVPAEICSNCGEEYVGEAEAEKLLALADEMVRIGVQVTIREFAAA